MIRILPKPLVGLGQQRPTARHVCTASIKETPSARSFAIRVRNVGNGAVDGSSSKHARVGEALLLREAGRSLSRAATASRAWDRYKSVWAP